MITKTNRKPLVWAVLVFCVLVAIFSPASLGSVPGILVALTLIVWWCDRRGWTGGNSRG